MQHDTEIVEVQVLPGKVFHTILTHNKSTRTPTDYKPGQRLKVTLRAAKAFSDRLRIVGGHTVTSEDAPASEILEDRAGAMEEFDATQAAAAFAVKASVDLARVKGTGAGGRILMKDVKAAVA